MTEKKALLLEFLQIALELELATLPPYLVALLSIKTPSNRAAAEVIRSVAVEEMLHMALVANVINAVGGQPKIDKTTIPRFPLQMTFKGRPFADRQFPIKLALFSAATIETFLKIEMPHHVAETKKFLQAGLDVPALTIGDFYGQIITLLEELDVGGDLFIGDPARQLGKGLYWSSGGELVRVTDLATAKAALDLVIVQGEGAAPADPSEFAVAAADRRTQELGHYYRFKEILHGRFFGAGDDPDGNPTGASMMIDYLQVYPIKLDAAVSDYPEGSEAADLNVAFNRQYTLMLRQIGEAFNGQPAALYTAIMNGMHQLSSLARQLMSSVIPGSDRTGCPTFEWQDP